MGEGIEHQGDVRVGQGVAAEKAARSGRRRRALPGLRLLGLRSLLPGQFFPQDLDGFLLFPDDLALAAEFGIQLIQA
jgi:hypothetical protein